MYAHEYLLKGFSEKPAGFKVGIVFRNDIVKAGHAVVQLGTHAADKKVLVGRHFPEDDCRPVLHCSIGLRDRRQNGITFPHRPD